MDGVITYLNTDLDLTSSGELTALAAALESSGISPGHVTHGDNGLWYATFETDEQYDAPEANIAAMLNVVEALTPPLRAIWSGCSQREFNIGYDFGLQPWGFNQGLSTELLGRISAAGASLRVTLYPDGGKGTPETE